MRFSIVLNLIFISCMTLKCNKRYPRKEILSLLFHNVPILRKLTIYIQRHNRSLSFSINNFLAKDLYCSQKPITKFNKKFQFTFCASYIYFVEICFASSCVKFGKIETYKNLLFVFLIAHLHFFLSFYDNIHEIMQKDLPYKQDILLSK